MRKVACVAHAVLLVTYASLQLPNLGVLGEPTNRTQLWQDVGCGGDGATKWRIVEMTRLRGVAVAEDSTLPLHAMIYVRAWPDGMVIETRTDIRGRFRLKVPNGAYEIAICRPGWKAWRGAIRVQRGGLQDYNFELELGS